MSDAVPHGPQRTKTLLKSALASQNRQHHFKREERGEEKIPNPRLQELRALAASEFL